VERALKAVPGVLSAEVNLASESARVRFAEGVADAVDLVRATDAAGYPAHLAEAPGGGQAFVEKKDAEYRLLWRDMAPAAALALPIFVVEMGGTSSRPFTTGSPQS